MTDDVVRALTGSEQPPRALVQGGFADALDAEDRRRLRAVVKRVYLRLAPTHLLTDHEADRVIDAVAPETQIEILKRASFAGMVEVKPTVVGGVDARKQQRTRITPALAFPDQNLPGRKALWRE